jgi:hypothetical protein
MPTDGNNAPYFIDRVADGGWRLRGQRIFDVCENGQCQCNTVSFAERLEDLSA